MKPEPKAGDLKEIKGVLCIRQPLRNHKGTLVVAHGKPRYEWVPKGGPKDRTSRDFVAGESRVVQGAEHE